MTIEVRDDQINPDEFIILENTDTELTLANLTLEPKTFFIEGLDITQEVPAGETIAITVNAPIGEYDYGIVDEEALQGTLQVIERAVTPTAEPITPVPTSAPIPPPPGG